MTMNDDFENALKFFPPDPGLQIPRTNLLAKRGVVRLSEGWAVHSHLDDLSCGGAPQEPEVLAAMPPVDWTGFCYAAPDWEGVLRQAFNAVVRWPRVGFIGREPYPEPEHPVRWLAPRDVKDIGEIDEPWLWKYHESIAHFIENENAFGAEVGGHIRSIAAVFAEDGVYADLGLATHPDFRKRGLVRSCVVALCAEMVGFHITPFAETGADNASGRAMPRSMGWEEIRLPDLFCINRVPPPGS
jgi:ribosomal protein S18 acetylase RimI-like enzyme